MKHVVHDRSLDDAPFECTYVTATICQQCKSDSHMLRAEIDDGACEAQRSTFRCNRLLIDNLKLFVKGETFTDHFMCFVCVG